jgi:hypothetical protein
MKNQGQGPTLAASKLRLQMYSGATSVGSAFDCSVNAGLLAGYSHSCGWALTAPQTAGMYSVRATADADAAVAESNESNNIASASVSVVACQWYLPIKTVVLPAGAGAAQIPVETSLGCETSLPPPDVPWLTAAPPYPSGPGMVTLWYTPNPGPARSTTLTVAGQTVRVTQTAAGCTYAISPGSGNVSSQAGTKSLRVTTGTGCPWWPEIQTGWQWMTALRRPLPHPCPQAPG